MNNCVLTLQTRPSSAFIGFKVALCVIDHSYVAHTDTIYKQVIGMAMGVHNGPQTTNLYCAHYELQYVLRRSKRHYLRTLKLYITVPATPKDKLLRAETTSLFNT
jgi:hypothetical protein